VILRKVKSIYWAEFLCFIKEYPYLTAQKYFPHCSFIVCTFFRKVRDTHSGDDGTSKIWVAQGKGVSGTYWERFVLNFFTRFMIGRCRKLCIKHKCQKETKRRDRGRVLAFGVSPSSNVAIQFYWVIEWDRTTSPPHHPQFTRAAGCWPSSILTHVN